MEPEILRNLWRSWLRRCRALLACALLLFAGAAAALQSTAQDPAAALRAKYLVLQPQLAAQAFGEPLTLDSREGSDAVSGEVHAELPFAFAEVAATFKSPSSLCELLFLHLNVRECRTSTSAGGSLSLTVGPKRASALGSRYHMDYALRTEVDAPDYLKVTLSADEGPLSTRDYRIVLEAMPLAQGRSFLRLGYSYGYGFVAKVAMKAYLATAGRSKIGFTVLGRDDAGQPIRVRGERGALERNVIRYYLALLSYWGAKGGTPHEQTEARLRAWFANTERYAAQLHELELDEYLREKHDDLAHRPGTAP